MACFIFAAECPYEFIPAAEKDYCQQREEEGCCACNPPLFKDNTQPCRVPREQHLFKISPSPWVIRIVKTDVHRALIPPIHVSVAHLAVIHVA